MVARPARYCALLGPLLEAVDAALTRGRIPEPVQQAYRNEWRPAYAKLDGWATKSSVA